MSEDFTSWLQERLQKPLPGVEAQYRMAMQGRKLPTPPSASSLTHRKAAVLNLLHWHEDAWRTILICRAENPHDRHSGQVSFPGGSMDDADGGDLAVTALREAEEEIGVSRHKIQLLGALTELYIPVSNFLVQPFVGVLLEKTAFQLQASEAVEVLTPSLTDFFIENKKQKDLDVGVHGILREVPFYEVHGRTVWGATAMILSEFESVFREYFGNDQ